MTGMADEFETYRAFWRKYALGSIAPPSCFGCGQETREPKTRHMELPDVVLCERCARIRELEEELRVTVDLYKKALIGWSKDRTDLERLREVAQSDPPAKS